MYVKGGGGTEEENEMEVVSTRVREDAICVLVAVLVRPPTADGCDSAVKEHILASPCFARGNHTETNARKYSP